MTAAVVTVPSWGDSLEARKEVCHAQSGAGGTVLSALGFPEGVSSHPSHPAMPSCPWDCQPLPGRTGFYIYSILFPCQVTHAALRQGQMVPGTHFHPKRTQDSMLALEFPRVLEDIFLVIEDLLATS